MLQLQIKNILKKKKLTLTRARKKVLKAFLNINKPLSFQQIKLLIGNFDRVTLFRVLSVFEQRKIIHVINLDKGGKLYALCDDQCKGIDANHNHNHIHFCCENCNDVFCLTVNEFPKLSVPDYIFKNLSINASGICITCIKK